MPALLYALAAVTVAMLGGKPLVPVPRGDVRSPDGDFKSLIYFREIACRTETNFIDAIRAEEEESRVKDLLGQVWRNSCILTAKFDALKWAFILMALAIIPWGATVALFSSQSPSIQTVITK